MSLAGIILAAGESRRMGSPKPLLELAGETFVDRLVLTLSVACSPVIVVLGWEPERIRAGIRRVEQAKIVVNPDYALGQLSSLQCGIAAAPAGVEGLIFTPVDYPAVLPSTVVRLARAFEARAPNQLVFLPRCQERSGHPVCVSRELFAEFLALGPEAAARDVIHRHAEQTVYVEVDDPGILLDVDDPETYRRLTEGLS
jgi:molybdenum cofactor cytidylyltransferase